MGCGASAGSTARETPKSNVNTANSSEAPGREAASVAADRVKENHKPIEDRPFSLQEKILCQLVPDDVLHRKALQRKDLTRLLLSTLRGEVRYQQVSEAFPECTIDTTPLVVDYEQKAAALAGGSFNAEPGEGKTPPADPDLVWDRGYLLGDEAHEVVPLITAKLFDGASKPVAILLHGTGSCKEKMIPHMTTYARQGFLAVSMDHRYLGERSLNGELNPALALVNGDGSLNMGEANANLGQRLAVWARLSRSARLASYQVAMKKSALGETMEHPFVFDSAWDVVRLVDYLATRPDVKKDGDDPVVGIMGVSLGGMVTQLAAGGDTRIKAAAPMISMQCFDLQKVWRMWAPRCKTLQIPFKAVAERDGCIIEDVEAKCAKASRVRELRLRLNEDLYDKLGVSDQMTARDEMVAEDDRFMREIGVDEAVVEKVYSVMNPGLLDGDLDGPQVMRALAPRPLLLANAAAGQRCPIESIYQVFHETKNSWTKCGKGRDMRLYVACQPILHHSDREDMHFVINQFLRSHILGVDDDDTTLFGECDDEGKQVEPVPGQTGWMFSGAEQVLDKDTFGELTLQEQVLAKLVPGDVLQRHGLNRETLTSSMLKDLRGKPHFEQVSTPFPVFSDSTDDICVSYEENAAALAGGKFNAEPGEGETPPADPELEWERGYLLGEAPHEIIPLLLAKLGDGAVRPAAIMLHGTGSSKEKMIPHLAEYAKAGFVAVSMDHRYLGERSMIPELNPNIALYSETGGVNLGDDCSALAQRLAIWPRLSRPARLASYQVAMKKSALGESVEHPFVFDSTWDVVRLVDYLATRGDVKKDGSNPCVCLWGISLGGMVTQLAAASDLRIMAAAPMISVQCFDLQREWKVWAPRCRTLQIPFKAVAEKEGCFVEDIEGDCEKASEFRKVLIELYEDFFDHLGIKDQILGPREDLIKADDMFMREIGVDERAVKLTYDTMNPHLLDGLLDGPEALQAIAPRPLLMCNAGAGQRCPIETVWEIFQTTRDAWGGDGQNLNLYVACQPMVHHAVAPDFLVMILQFMRKRVLGIEDSETAILAQCSKLGTALEPVPGHTGMLFRGDNAASGF